MTLFRFVALQTSKEVKLSSPRIFKFKSNNQERSNFVISNSEVAGYISLTRQDGASFKSWNITLQLLRVHKIRTNLGRSSNSDLGLNHLSRSNGSKSPSLTAGEIYQVWLLNLLNREPLIFKRGTYFNVNAKGQRGPTCVLG